MRCPKCNHAVETTRTKGIGRFFPVDHHRCTWCQWWNDTETVDNSDRNPQNEEQEKETE